MTKFFGQKNLLITEHKSCHSCIFFSKEFVWAFWSADSSVPAYSLLSSGLVTIPASASCRGSWSMHSQTFEF